MLLGNAKTQDWSFLNDFQWSRAVDQLTTKLLGEVAPPPHWKFEIHTTAVPTMMATEIAVGLRIQPFSINILGHLEHRSGWVTSKGRDIPNYDFHGKTPTERAIYLMTVIEALLLDLGTSLYEYDPRIGHLSFKGPLPLSTLLDPPGKWGRHPNQFGPEYLCPLCDEEMTSNREFMWGGGNLMWAHPQCWRDA